MLRGIGGSKNRLMVSLRTANSGQQLSGVLLLFGGMRRGSARRARTQSRKYFGSLKRLPKRLPKMHRYSGFGRIPPDFDGASPFMGKFVKPFES